MFLKRYMVIVTLLAGVACSAAGSDLLSREVMDRISRSVYEVVVLKPVADSLSYESELPYDSLPYSERMDKYYSIGTAFAIAKDRFLTAAHIFDLEFATGFQYFLRDSEGEVYEIGDFLKYSNNKDFALFTVKGLRSKAVLPIDTKPELNETVFAVGNALGEGIIVRNGIFTSKTPEEENGEWKWIRFSAAASPGNSGGPLLNKSGEVIGIVVMKSENENLNYALPLSIVKETKENSASIHHRFTYVLPNMKLRKKGVYDHEVELPKSYSKLKGELVGDLESYTKKLLADMLKGGREEIFPHSKDSLELLHNTFSRTFPQLIAERKDGSWSLFYPEDIGTVDLDEGGEVMSGAMAGYQFVYLRKPEDVSHRELWDDPKLHMDMMLKGIDFSRNMAGEAIEVTSLGEAAESYLHEDSYGRKWLFNSWDVEYNDSRVISCSLLVPEGMVTIMTSEQVGVVSSGLLFDLKALTDFIYLSYYGTYSQWTDFLKLKELLPQQFASINFSYEEGGRMNFKSDRFSFSYDESVYPVTDTSDMSLLFTFFKEGDEVVWDIGGVYVWEDRSINNFFAIFREPKPVKGLKDDYFDIWKNIYKQAGPYNGRAYVDEDFTYIRKIHSKYDELKEKRRVSNDYIYTIAVGIKGNVKNFAMKKKLSAVTKRTMILE